MPIIITPGAGAAEELEQLELDGLALASSTFRIESLSMPPPAKKPEFVSGADSDGAILARDPKHENRVIEAVIGVQQQANHAAVVAHIGTLLDKLQECGRNANGLPLVWDPAGSTADPITFRCVLGEITDLPITWESLRFSNAWQFTIRLTCLPFGEGAEYQVATVTSAAPMIPLELANIPGDVPALGRLVVTDAASRSRRYVAWGLESRWYPTSSPPSLIVDTFTTTGYAGTSAADATAYGGSWITATLRTQVQAICGLGNLSHVGAFRPQLRFYASATTMAVRLTFQALDGPMRSLSYKVPVVVGWNHVDLGVVTVPAATLGTQRWTGSIEAYSTAAGGETFRADAIWLMPAEQYGRARATTRQQASVMTGYDDFTGTTAGALLNARVAPAGGTWATVGGSATDFAFADAPGVGAESASRSTTVDAVRYAILGSTAYTNTDAQVRIQRTGAVGFSEVVARWTDYSNRLVFRYDGLAGATGSLSASVSIAGFDTLIAFLSPYTLAVNTPYILQIVVYASGNGEGRVLDANGALLATLPFYHSSLATGGALASGKAGFGDGNGQAAASIRYYDNFYAATPAAEPIVCYSGQTITFASDGVLREDSTGVYAGQPPEYLGGFPMIPNAGGPARRARVAVIARRNDVATAADNAVAADVMDSTTVTAFATARYLAIPRA